MKKIMMSVVAVVMAIGFAGCDDTSSPAAVLGVAAKAVKEGKVKEFKKTLAGDALKRYGNAEGMKTLRAAFEGKSLSIENSTLEKQVIREWGFVRTYGVNVLGTSVGSTNGKRVLSTKVVCTSQDTQYDTAQPTTGPVIPRDTYPSNSAVYVTFCYISEIN